MFFQLGLVVPEIHMAGSSAHEQLDNAFCPWWMMERLKCGACTGRLSVVRRLLTEGLILKQHHGGSE